MSVREWPSVSALIPHAGDAILIDRVLAHDGETTSVRVIVGAKNSLRRKDGPVPAWLAVEYMAQAIAAHEGLLAWTEGRALPLGFLISATSLELRVSGFDPAETLRVDSRRVRGRPGLGVLSHHCTLVRDRDGANASPVADGRLSIALDRASNWGKERSRVM
jgi:predicted hotdog family 3-hydroxylacyl-ACP dehydratase